MNSVIPVATTLFYLSSGFMLVAGMAAVAVAIIARTKHYKFLYGAFALLCISGAGYQIAGIYYSHSKLITQSVALLAVQADMATLCLFSTAVFIYMDVCRGKDITRLALSLAALFVLVVVANHASTFSLRYATVENVIPIQNLWGNLYLLTGRPGIGSYLWHGLMVMVLLVPAYNAYQMWRQSNPFRGLTFMISLVLIVVTLMLGLATDFGMTNAPYLMGFSVNLLVAFTAVDMALQSAQRSQELVKRDMQMQSEVRQRRKIEDKLQRLSQVFTQAPAPVHIVDMQGKTLQVNEASIRYLRRDVSLPPKVNFLDMFEKLGVDKQILLASLIDGKVKDYGPYYFFAGVPVDSLYVVRDAYLKFKVYPIFDQNRQLKEFVVGLEDVTEKQFVESAIQSISSAVSQETGHAFFKNLVEQLAKLLKVKYVYIALKKQVDNEAQMETMAVATDGKLSENFCFKLDGTPSALVLEKGHFAEPRSVQEQFGEQDIVKDLGVQSYIGAAILDQKREPIGVLAILDRKPMDSGKRFLEIVQIFVSRAGTELQRIESEKRIRKMAYEDYLTGLPNRTELNEYVSELLKMSELSVSSEEPIRSLFFQVDLDHFKTINDALGHDVGDEVIRILGCRLADFRQDNMLIARIGGDEFAIVVSPIGEDIDLAIETTVRLIVNLLERPVQVGEHLLDVGCTLGVVLFPDFATTTVDVFRNADTALYKAKAAGRGNYHVFTPELRDQVTKRLEVEKGIRTALHDNEFLLYYQPQVDDEGNMVGAEALIRWEHPVKGMIPPIAFIPVAEETGLITSVGQWVLEQALRSRKSWSGDQVPFMGHLSVNVSAWQFNRPDFVLSTIRLIEDAGVPPSHITLEVTETALLNDIEDTIEKLSELRRFGLSIALDDFGTGYSSLAYLRDLPLDILKIDKTFVDVLETHAHEPLVESMISIGRHMGLEVVAEGVESRIQLERLKSMGCHKFQGYFFSKPLPEQDFIDWLKNKDT